MTIWGMILPSLYFLLILVIIWFHARSTDMVMQPQMGVLFRIIRGSMLLILMDVICIWADGKSGVLPRMLNEFCNLGLFAIGLFVAGLWPVYAERSVAQSQALPTRATRLYYAFVILGSILLVINSFTGFIYYFDANNTYIRGKFMWVYVTFFYAIYLYATVFILIHKKNIPSQQFWPLLLFSAPLILSNVLQLLNLGVALTSSGLTLSVLLVFLNMQQQSSNIDYLTGLYNRRQLDEYGRMKIRNCSESKTFSAILIDLNNFKHINDTYGHYSGDAAIRDTVRILQSCTHINDFIARFGGDEFILILNLGTYGELESVVSRIRKSVDEFNSSGRRPYQLGFAMGYDVYDPFSGMDADEFFQHLDALMYQDKADDK